MKLLTPTLLTVLLATAATLLPATSRAAGGGSGADDDAWMQRAKGLPGNFAPPHAARSAAAAAGNPAALMEISALFPEATVHSSRGGSAEGPDGAAAGAFARADIATLIAGANHSTANGASEKK